MAVAILDSTVIVHILRKNQSALKWFATQSNLKFAISSITWLEIMAGVPNKQAQANTSTLLAQFEVCYLIKTDQKWAMQQIQRFRFSHSLGISDCLIASASYRLKLPLYTHNLKDMIPMLGTQAIKPYT